MFLSPPETENPGDHDGEVMAVGYGSRHRARRRQLLPAAVGRPCPGGCGRILRDDPASHLDHSQTPLVVDATSVGDRILCGPCNTAAGARLGNERRNLRPSRQW
jgi:hypothetical protein